MGALVDTKTLRNAIPAEPPRLQPVELSVIVPTFNERANLPALVAGLTSALADIRWELIVVDDDSPDGTAEEVRRWHGINPRVRILRRIGRRGLSSACIEGALASSAPYLAVMDADGQHDPRLLPSMLTVLKSDEADLVVGSRHVENGGIGAWSGWRAQISQVATGLAHTSGLRQLSDPMSGFFAIRREAFDARAPHLAGRGFKILLELIVAHPAFPPGRVRELGFKFGLRTRGESKFSLSVAWECLATLVQGGSGGLISRRFLTFGCVGAFGFGVHLAILGAAYRLLNLSFGAAQIAALSGAIVSNYVLNNILTYGDRSNRGWRWISGLVSFGMICGSSAWANFEVSQIAFRHGAPWAAAALAGAATGALWNYIATARITWRA